MTKKIALLMVVMLLASALVFVSCSQNAGGGGTKPPAQITVVKDYKGKVSDNLVRNGNFDEDSEFTDVEHSSSDQGVDASIVADVGIGGSKALKVESIKNWGEIDIDMTRVYGRGKSYYIEASFKDDGTPADKKDSAVPSFSFTVVNNYVVETYGEDYYDEEDWAQGGNIYDGNNPMDDDVALVTFGIETNQDAAPLSDDWQTLSAIIPATVIDKFIGDSTLYKFVLTFYVGEYSDDPNGGQKGYKYLVDNVVVKDLNTEIDATGAYIDDSYVPKEEEKPVEDDDE